MIPRKKAQNEESSFDSEHIAAVQRAHNVARHPFTAKRVLVPPFVSRGRVAFIEAIFAFRFNGEILSPAFPRGNNASCLLEGERKVYRRHLRSANFTRRPLLLIYISRVTTPCRAPSLWRHPFNRLSDRGKTKLAVLLSVERGERALCVSRRDAVEKQDAIKKLTGWVQRETGDGDFDMVKGKSTAVLAIGRPDWIINESFLFLVF